MINKTSKALEYLFINPEGNLISLSKKISGDQIEVIKKSNCLDIDGKNYVFNQNGIDCYLNEYQPYMEKGLIERVLGI
jgi:hypothetical protein